MVTIKFLILIKVVIDLWTRFLMLSYTKIYWFLLISLFFLNLYSNITQSMSFDTLDAFFWLNLNIAPILSKVHLMSAIVGFAKFGKILPTTSKIINIFIVKVDLWVILWWLHLLKLLTVKFQLYLWLLLAIVAKFSLDLI